jgi:hypothetical protein
VKSNSRDGYLTGKVSTAQASLDQAVKKSNSALVEYNSALQ